MKENIQTLKEKILNHETFRYESIPHWHYLDGFVEAIDKPREIREAYARYNFYCHVPVYIEPGELITGKMDRNEPFFQSMNTSYIDHKIVDRIMGDDTISTGLKDSLKEKLKVVEKFCYNLYKEGLLTDEEKLAQESGTGFTTSFNGHIIPNFEYVLKKGWKGILEDIKIYREQNCKEECRLFYDAMEITVKGIMQVIKRHGDLAQALLREKNPCYDEYQLNVIKNNCHALVENPPDGFLQALQLIWFVMMFTDYDSFGRFDQYAYPYYVKSVGEHEMNEKLALEYLQYLWLKVEETGGILNMTIGGVLPDGGSGINGLTSLAMKATRDLGLKSPNLCVRVSKNTPGELWKEIHASLSTGQGLPALYNEDLIIPMLLESGICPEDARDFALAGCSQVIIPGKSNFSCDVGLYNTLKCLELALHDGFDPVTNKQAGPHTGCPEDLNTFEKLMDAYYEQVQYAVKLGTSINNKDIILRKEEGACVRSLLTDDCLKKGIGFFHGGARYAAVQNEIAGLTNTANSLIAIKQVVYEKGEMTLEDMVGILDANYSGYEQVRMKLRNKIPKFGNDNDEVDSIRVRISEHIYNEIRKYKGEIGGIHQPGEVVFTYHESCGNITGATPDGRKAGEVLADSAGPAQGTDVSGPTALLNSMLKIPQHLCGTCCVLNLKFDKSLWQKNRDKVIQLLQYYIASGGFQLQINVTDSKILKEAVKFPEQYNSLVVRVGGFSEYFTRLSPAIRDEIIRRTEQELY